MKNKKHLLWFLPAVLILAGFMVLGHGIPEVIRGGWIALGLLGIMVLGLGIWWKFFTPDGWEDAAGFHYGKPPEK